MHTSSETQGSSKTGSSCFDGCNSFLSDCTSKGHEVTTECLDCDRFVETMLQTLTDKIKLAATCRVDDMNTFLRVV